MKNRVKTFITDFKDAITDWWLDYGNGITITLLTGTAVACAVKTCYWKGKYDGIIENRNH